jgi:hypothetical protein
MDLNLVPGFSPIFDFLLWCFPTIPEEITLWGSVPIYVTLGSVSNSEGRAFGVAHASAK